MSRPTGFKVDKAGPLRGYFVDAGRRYVVWRQARPLDGSQEWAAARLSDDGVIVLPWLCEAAATRREAVLVCVRDQDELAFVGRGVHLGADLAREIHKRFPKAGLPTVEEVLAAFDLCEGLLQCEADSEPADPEGECEVIVQGDRWQAWVALARKALGQKGGGR